MILFLWFCLVTVVGPAWRQLRGWPVNWFLEMDPLAALGVLLTTGSVYRGMLWAVAILVLTVFLGRVFCGWICPFGTMHQFVGWLGRRKRSARVKREMNRPRKAQVVKYYLLVVFILSAVGARFAGSNAGSLGLAVLDPIPLVYRSVNLAVLPLADNLSEMVQAQPRHYDGAALIGALFIVFLLLNLWIPRFYCRFICPLGALLGWTSRLAFWRIGKTRDECSHCKRCEWDCEGACDPDGAIQVAECVECMNCLRACPDHVITYSPAPSASGEVPAPDLQRRRLLGAAVGGAAFIPILRLGGKLGENWNSNFIRPPGSLNEEDFLSRCIKCGQCMRGCPSNIIHPAGPEYGTEKLWTPHLNFRIGTSGCQYNCNACGNICPTGAIKPLSLAEKHGAGDFEVQGPVKLGTAFVDRGRCLPWAMDRPCIVCQENCPVSPKAIYIREEYRPVREARMRVKSAEGTEIRLMDRTFEPGTLNTGDYYVRAGARQYAIDNNDWQTLFLQESLDRELPENAPLELLIHLQLPYVDPALCIGCGICEHECPVSGKRAIRVYAENESRDKDHVLML